MIAVPSEAVLNGARALGILGAAGWAAIGPLHVRDFIRHPNSYDAFSAASALAVAGAAALMVVVFLS